MNLESFENANDRQEIEAEFLVFSRMVLDPAKTVIDRDGKIRLYKSPYLRTEDVLDLRFFWQEPDAVFPHGQWFCRVIDGAKPDSPPIDFYSVFKFCEYLEEIFLHQLAE